MILLANESSPVVHKFVNDGIRVLEGLPALVELRVFVELHSDGLLIRLDRFVLRTVLPFIPFPELVIMRNPVMNTRVKGIALLGE